MSKWVVTLSINVFTYALTANSMLQIKRLFWRRERISDSYVAIGLDITKTRKVEQSLERSGEREREIGVCCELLNCIETFSRKQTRNRNAAVRRTGVLCKGRGGGWSWFIDVDFTVHTFICIYLSFRVVGFQRQIPTSVLTSPCLLFLRRFVSLRNTYKWWSLAC
jgi:hypothetical protein